MSRPLLPDRGDLPAAPGRLYLLHPGDVAVAERGDRFETLLGSSVSIVLTDPDRTIAAMCHLVQTAPGAAGGSGGAHTEPLLEAMLEGLRRRGIDPATCEAYLYGGGNMFPAQATGGRVGLNNARWALAALDGLGIRLVAHDVGGTTSRRIRWTVGPLAPSVKASEV